MVVKNDDAECSIAGLTQQLCGPLELRGRHAAGLMAPGANGVEADGEDRVRAVDGLGRLPVALELDEGAREPGWKRVGDVVVSGNHEHPPAQAFEKAGGARVLLRAATVGEVAARDDQLRAGSLDQGGERRDDLGRLVGADVEVGEMEDARRQGRWRLH